MRNSYLTEEEKKQYSHNYKKQYVENNRDKKNKLQHNYYHRNKQRINEDTKPSRFLEAIPTELTEEWEVSTW